MVKINEDLKHCDPCTACQILEENAEDAWFYLYKNKDVYNDFCKCQIDNDYSIAEYIWLKHWNEFIEYLMEEY